MYVSNGRLVSVKTRFMKRTGSLQTELSPAHVIIQEILEILQRKKLHTEISCFTWKGWYLAQFQNLAVSKPHLPE